MRIRSAEASDLDAVCAIEAAWPTSAGWKRRQFEAELANPQARFVVAEVEGRACAFAVFRIVPPEAQILDLAVSPGSARRGVGRYLLDAVVDHARRLRLSKLTLEVRADNEPAIRLYRAAGFKVVGSRPKFYNLRVDAVLMDRDLS